MSAKQAIEDVARMCAKRVAKSWGMDDWRDYYTGAYEGVKAARERGVEESRMIGAARQGIIDRLRKESGGKRKGERLLNWTLGQQFSPEEEFDDGEYLIEDKRTYRDPEKEMLEFWGETKQLRRYLTIRDRIMIYLAAIEGMPLSEIAKVFTLNVTRVPQILRQYISNFTDESFQELSRGIH